VLLAQLAEQRQRAVLLGRRSCADQRVGRLLDLEHGDAAVVRVVVGHVDRLDDAGPDRRLADFGLRPCRAAARSRSSPRAPRARVQLRAQRPVAVRVVLARHRDVLVVGAPPSATSGHHAAVGVLRLSESALPPVRVANTPRLPIPSIETVTLLRDLTDIYATPRNATLTMASSTSSAGGDMRSASVACSSPFAIVVAVLSDMSTLNASSGVSPYSALVEVAEQQPGQVALDLAEQVAAAVDLGGTRTPPGSPARRPTDMK
jgi:hypothetical protein